MKILWHMPTFRSRTCGLSNRAIHLARELILFGHDVTFLVRRDCTSVSLGRISGISVRCIDVSKLTPVHWSLQGLTRANLARLVAQQIDTPHDLFISCQPEVVTGYREEYPKRPIVFVCGGSTILQEAADVCRGPARSNAAKIAFGIDRYIKRRNERMAFHAADAVVLNSQTTRQCIIEQFGVAPDKTHAILGGLDAARFRPCSVEDRLAARQVLGISDRERLVVWTGRLSCEKNVACLIEAISQCRTPDIRLKIVGEGDERRSLQALASRLGISEQTGFVGECAEVRPYLFAADLFVFPSIAESFGNSLAEAMACGLPCIAIRGDGQAVRNASEEILANGECGVLVDGNDARRLATAIDMLLEDGLLRRRLGSAAARRAAASFGWASAGRKLNSIALQVASQRTSPKPATGRAFPMARVAVESILG